jgi:hypothetical protein
MSCAPTNKWPSSLPAVIEIGSDWQIDVVPSEPFDFSELTNEMVFREQTVDGALITTVTGTEPEPGRLRFVLPASVTETFTDGQRIYFSARSKRDDPAYVWPAWVFGTATAQLRHNDD